jgi:glyoxylase-like metal-dependent hydrolase (beta-lactamase superfamily II)
MIEQVLPNIFLIKIPLPENPLRILNSYLIKDPDRNLLIDTGFNLEACQVAMDKALFDLGVSMKETDLFITHLHTDHSGLVQHLFRPGDTVWMGKDDALVFEANMRENVFINTAGQLLQRSGLLLDGAPNCPQEEATAKYADRACVPITVVLDGDILSKGGYTWRAVATPGHTAGHMCLYEAEHKILIAGDHILDKITPNIGLWSFQYDPLGQYLPSLDKIAALDVELVLPGHRNLITDMRGRIREIKEHHGRRLQDVLQALGEDKKTTVQVARRIPWDLSYKHWDEFPLNQKMHACAEALAHLYHLVVRGQLIMSEEEGVLYFQAAPDGGVIQQAGE